MNCVFTEPTLEVLPETELIRNAQRGDLHAFERLYSAHKKRVFALCLRIAGDHSLAEDFTQDVFLLAFRRIQTFRGASGFSSWLHRIAVNVVLGHLRRRKCRPDIDSDWHIDTGDEDQQDFETLIAQRGNYIRCEPIDGIALERAIALLPAGYRLMFQLHDIEGYNHVEIAEMLGCSVGNSKSQLHKARMALRAHLQSVSALPRSLC